MIVSRMMNQKLLVAWLALPIGLVALCPQSVLADERHDNPNHQPRPAETVQRSDAQSNGQGHMHHIDRNSPNRNRRASELRNEARQQEIRRQQEFRAQLRRNEVRRDEDRVWVPGHIEYGFLGLSSYWAEGHWAQR